MFLRSKDLLDIYKTETSKRVAIAFVSCVLGITLGSNAGKEIAEEKQKSMIENGKKITMPDTTKSRSLNRSDATQMFKSNNDYNRFIQSSATRTISFQPSRL